MFFSIRDDSSPQVTISINNTHSLHGNMASFNGNVLKDFIQGAGLYFELFDEFDSKLVKNINLFILNSNFFHNYAEGGGGVYIEWGAKTAGQVKLSNCKFVSNTGTFGSAFYVQGFAYSSFLSTDANPLIFSASDVNVNDNKPDQTEVLNHQSSSITIQDMARAIFDQVTIFNNLVTGLMVFGSTIVF